MRKKNEEPKVKENAAVVSFLCHSTSLSILSHPSSHVRRRRRGYARTSRETGWGLRDEWRPRSESRDTRPSVSGSLGSVVTPLLTASFTSPAPRFVSLILSLVPQAPQAGALRALHDPIDEGTEGTVADRVAGSALPSATRVVSEERRESRATSPEKRDERERNQGNPLSYLSSLTSFPLVPSSLFQS